MVLVDTSVWIRFFSGQPLYTAKLDQLLELDRVIGHDLVYGELLIGDCGGRKAFLAQYAQMNWASTVPHDEVVAFVCDRRLHGRGISWIDVHLLAAAIVAEAPIWTADTRFAAVARELGVTYEPFPHKVG